MHQTLPDAHVAHPPASAVRDLRVPPLRALRERVAKQGEGLLPQRVVPGRLRETLAARGEAPVRLQHHRQAVVPHREERAHGLRRRLAVAHRESDAHLPPRPLFDSRRESALELCCIPQRLFYYALLLRNGFSHALSPASSRAVL